MGGISPVFADSSCLPDYAPLQRAMLPVAAEGSYSGAAADEGAQDSAITLAFVTDLGRGLGSALEVVFSSAHVLHCTVHRKVPVCRQSF